jgi:hypothetical protein
LRRYRVLSETGEHLVIYRTKLWPILHLSLDSGRMLSFPRVADVDPTLFCFSKYAYLKEFSQVVEFKGRGRWFLGRLAGMFLEDVLP